MRSSFHHSVSLIALFIIGNMIISFPKGEGKTGSFSGFFLCTAVSFALTLFYSRLQSFNSFGCNILSVYKGNRFLKYTSLGVLMLLCLLSYTFCIKEYVVLVDSVRLPNTSRFIIAPIFCALSVMIAFSKKKICEMFSLVSFIFIIIASVFIFLLSLGNFSFSMLKNNISFCIPDILRQSLTFFIHSFGQILIVLLFIGNKTKADAKRTELLGIGSGAIILFFSLFCVFSLLGSLANNLRFPFSLATGSIPSFKGYSRLDGFTYYTYYICSLIKASVSFSVAVNLSAGISERFKKAVAVFFFAFATVFSVVKPLHIVLQSAAVNLILLLSEIAAPFFVAALLKNKSGNKRRIDNGVISGGNSVPG